MEENTTNGTAELSDIPSFDASTRKRLLIIGCFFLLISSLIIFGNVLVMVAVRRFKRLQTITNKFVFSLAVCDLLAGIIIIWQSAFNFNPELDYIGPACISRFVQVLPSYGSVSHLVGIAIDRYLAVLHPLRYHEFMTPRAAHIMLAIIWLLATLITSLMVFTSKYIPGESYCMLTNVVPRPVLIFALHVVFSLELVAMFYMYGSIFCVARRQAKQIQALEVWSKDSSDGIKRGSNMGKELKAARSLAFILLVFLLCHATFFAVITIGIIPNDIPIDKFAVYYKLSILIVFFNSLLNPIVYSLKNKEFKAAFKKILCRSRVQRDQNEDSLGFNDEASFSTKVTTLTIKSSDGMPNVSA